MLVGKSDLVKNTQKYRMAIACGYHIVSETCKCCLSDRSRALEIHMTCIGLKISIEKGSIQSPERFHVYGDETYGRTGAPKKAWESRDKKVPTKQTTQQYIYTHTHRHTLIL